MGPRRGTDVKDAPTLEQQQLCAPWADSCCLNLEPLLLQGTAVVGTAVGGLADWLQAARNWPALRVRRVMQAASFAGTALALVPLALGARSGAVTLGTLGVAIACQGLNYAGFHAHVQVLTAGLGYYFRATPHQQQPALLGPCPKARPSTPPLISPLALAGRGAIASRAGAGRDQHRWHPGRHRGQSGHGAAGPQRCRLPAGVCHYVCAVGRGRAGLVALCVWQAAATGDMNCINCTALNECLSSNESLNESAPMIS